MGTTDEAGLVEVDANELALKGLDYCCDRSTPTAGAMRLQPAGTYESRRVVVLHGLAVPERLEDWVGSQQLTL